MGPSSDLRQPLPYSIAPLNGHVHNIQWISAPDMVGDPGQLAFLPFPGCTGSVRLPPPPPPRGMVQNSHFQQDSHDLRRVASPHIFQQPAGQVHSQPPMPEISSSAAFQLNNAAQPFVAFPQGLAASSAALDSSMGGNVGTVYGPRLYSVSTGAVYPALSPPQGMAHPDSLQPDVQGFRQPAPPRRSRQAARQGSRQHPVPKPAPTATKYIADARPFAGSGPGLASSQFLADKSKGSGVGSLSSTPRHIATGKHVCPVCRKHMSGSNAQTECWILFGMLNNVNTTTSIH